MEGDEKFMRALRQGEIINSQTAKFSAWQTQRTRYQSMASFTERYVYRVAQPSVLTTLTSLWR